MSVVKRFYETAGKEAVFKTVSELDSMKVRLDEKKGGESFVKQFFCLGLYLFGLGVSIYLALQYSKIPFSDYTTASEEMTQILYYGTCCSSALFFFILIIKLLINRKYYSVVFSADREVIALKNRIEEYEKKREKRLQEMEDAKSLGYDMPIMIGEHVVTKITNIEERIARISGVQQKNMKFIVVIMYFCVSVITGGLISAFLQKGCYEAVASIVQSFGATNEWVENLSALTFGLSVVGAVFGGPVALYHYLYSIRLYSVNDWIIIPAFISGVLGFFVTAIAFGLVVGVIALVVAIVMLIVQVILAILAVIFIIAIIIGMLSGG